MTAYPELDALLAELVAGARAALGETFRGAYLQGSFALGGADEHSDVDFTIAVRREPPAGEVAALQTMHARLFALPTPWAQHLEGSYIPAASLRRLDPGAEYWYLENGWSELRRDEHCNTQVVRWCVRERGLTLAGPDPASLVDEVTGDDLRAEMLDRLDEWVEYGSAAEMSRWTQPYVVLSFCRMLATMETGEVVSKQEAAEWALRAVDPGWAALIRRALDDRPDPWRRAWLQAGPKDVARTNAFVEYAAALVRRTAAAARR